MTIETISIEKFYQEVCDALRESDKYDYDDPEFHLVEDDYYAGWSVTDSVEFIIENPYL